MEPAAQLVAMLQMRLEHLEFIQQQSILFQYAIIPVVQQLRSCIGMERAPQAAHHHYQPHCSMGVVFVTFNAEVPNIYIGMELAQAPVLLHYRVRFKEQTSLESFAGFHANQTNIYSGIPPVQAHALHRSQMRFRERICLENIAGTHASLLNFYTGMEAV